MWDVLVYGSIEIPLVRSVIKMFDQTTVIGGEQSGWHVAVADRLKLALPFCTGKVPVAETLVLLAAFGW
jgi:hypothetical protein